MSAAVQEFERRIEKAITDLATAKILGLKHGRQALLAAQKHIQVGLDASRPADPIIPQPAPESRDQKTIPGTDESRPA